jgi:heme exporter protein D
VGGGGGASVKEFFAMGGYALYVWGSYAVTFALLALEVVVLLKRKRETKT